MQTRLTEAALDECSYRDHREREEYNRTLILLIKAFSYRFATTKGRS